MQFYHVSADVYKCCSSKNDFFKRLTKLSKYLKIEWEFDFIDYYLLLMLCNFAYIASNFLAVYE